MVEKIFVSNDGDDSKNGTSRPEAIKSQKRLEELCKIGNPEVILMQGLKTSARLIGEQLDDAAAKAEIEQKVSNRKR